MAASSSQDGSSFSFQGTGISPGIVIGPVLALGSWQSGRGERRALASAEEAAREEKRFRQAVDLAEAQLLAVRKECAHGPPGSAAIIDSHLLMLRDRMLFERTIVIIREQRCNAEWALERSLEEIHAVFARIEDPYLRDRVQDVEQVGQGVFRMLAGQERQDFHGDAPRVIVAATDVAPEEVLRMAAEKVLGFFTARGGAVSHTAIVARTMGLPSVAGAEEAVRLAASGDLAIIDGDSGRIILRPNREQIEQYGELQRRQEQYSQAVAFCAHLAAETRDGVRLRLDANIEVAEEASQAMAWGAEGIGLFRSEYYYLGREGLPEEEALFETYRGLLTRLSPFAVTIRTLDAGGDKLLAGVGLGGETNPALGLRAIRFSLKRPEIFKVQLRALLRASAHGSLRIMFPMIASLDEVQEIREILASVEEELAARGHPCAARVPLGIMVEVPGAVAIADVLAREVDFLSIGTNDLTQYSLAIDRGNEQVAHMYDSLHPAVLRMIRHVVEAGHGAGIEVGLCGEMAGDLRCLPLLLGVGLDQLSMHPMAIPYVKRMLRNSVMEEAEALVAEALACASGRDVRRCLEEFLALRHPEEFDGRGVGLSRLRSRQG